MRRGRRNRPLRTGAGPRPRMPPPPSPRCGLGGVCGRRDVTFAQDDSKAREGWRHSRKEPSETSARRFGRSLWFEMMRHWRAHALTPSRPRRFVVGKSEELDLKFDE